MPIRTEHRLATLEANYASLNEKVDRIENNHLVHLQAAIDKVDTRTWVILGTIILGFLSSIAFQLWK